MIEPLSALNDDRLAAIKRDGRKLGFRMESEPRIWELLRGLASSKPGGRFLETGAGTGLSTFWLLQGMSRSASLVSVEREQKFLQVAQLHLGGDSRVQFRLGDDMSAIETIAPGSVDLCFADGEPGKYRDMDKVLDLLAPGGIYVVDDLFFRPHWPAPFQDLPARLLRGLYARGDGVLTVLEYGSGMAMFVRNVDGNKAE